MSFELPEFQIIIDTREQRAYRIKSATFDTLETGDYSFRGGENLFGIERKSRSDIWSSLTQGHDRFREEMKRASGFHSFIVLVECSPVKFLETERAGRKIHPNSLAGAVRKWRKEYGIEWVFVNNAGHGRRFVEWKLRSWYEEMKAGLWPVRSRIPGESSAA